MKKSFPLLIAGCLIFVSLFGAAACSKDEDADLKKDAHKISASAEDNICEHCGKSPEPTATLSFRDITKTSARKTICLCWK